MNKFLLAASIICFTSCQLDTKRESKEDKKSEKKKVTIEEVDAGIRANIEARTKEGGGYFNFTADSLELSLKLVRVHTEYLSVLGPNEFFACVDLATAEGNVYDVDFFLKGKPGAMEVTRTTLHKLNGKPYYTWKQSKSDKTWYTVPVKTASNDLLGVKEGEDRFKFIYEALLPEVDGEAQLWIPLASSDDFQTVSNLKINTPAEKQIITESKFGNNILYLSVDDTHSNGKITVEYDIVRKEKSAYTEDSDPYRYLEATPLIPVGDRFAVIANTVIEEAQASTPLTQARALYDYIIDNMRYAKEGTYGTGDANYACDSKSGNCTEFHSFFISLARSAGIPARFGVGASIPSSRDEGGIDGYHCWAEFYAEEKWWPVDISEGNKYTPLATYYFGHHPANRIELSKGRDLRPDPLPASGPINFLAYPVLEVEGDVVPVKTTFSFVRSIPNKEGV